MDGPLGPLACCSSVEDVVEEVRFVRGNDMLLAVRGGSYNAGGLGVCNDGPVLDLSLLRGIDVDPAARTATWRERTCRIDWVSGMRSACTNRA